MAIEYTVDNVSRLDYGAIYVYVGSRVTQNNQIHGDPRESKLVH